MVGKNLPSLFIMEGTAPDNGFSIMEGTAPDNVVIV